ncbi:MAG: nickel-dependent lactate racemase [Kiritimatiellae bacterium]|nr:nickel-dependent lactate racemase [Kiritimatiellia bacterium]MDD5522639.1 nickel-dependent lactate racemase [Kiritimatiellia bacterium]
MNIPSVLRDSAECLGIIESSGVVRESLTDRDIRQALCRPIWPDKGNLTVFNLVKPGESISMVVSDHTRKTAAKSILPILIDGLVRNGCSVKDMSILIASGIHRPPTPSELADILGTDIVRQFEHRIFRHDADDDANMIAVGTTKSGHCIRVNRKAIEADRLILIGAATYHYHAGFGGGRKSLVPGLASRDTIAHNHSLTLDQISDRIHPMVDLGILDNNPVSEEMLEGARMCNPDIIINTVLTPAGELVGVFSGDLDLAHRAACKLVEEVSRVDISKPADLVMASAGSAINWIQSHKALVNAHRAIKKGGRIILVAPCPEGLGDERFRYWVKKKNLSEIYLELRKSAEVLGQTAFSSIIRGTDAILVTEMNKSDTADLGIRTASDTKSAVCCVLDEMAKKGINKPTYYVMPEARYCVPFLHAK